MMRKKILFIFCLVAFSAGDASSRPVPEPQSYGRVILGNFTRDAGLAPVVFDHWLHRSKFTCRLCHVEVGFAMEAGATGINADLNRQGYYCGACHNGKIRYKRKAIFASCAADSPKEEEKRCARCHSKGKKGVRQYDFKSYARNLPRFKFGNAIDWEKAEDQGFIRPMDFLEGVAAKRDRMKEPEEFSITAKAGWASDVLFSHEKHTGWNGCEVCHPAIFPSTRQGTVKYTMLEINRGKYCGLCHLNVAFSVVLCHKCHKTPMR